ncbi:MAG: LPXTG cell wall anchor domain-containing protein [Clostridiales bacterium]
MKKIITISLLVVFITSLTFNVFATGEESLPGNPIYTSPEKVAQMSEIKDLEVFKIKVPTLEEKEYDLDYLKLKATFSIKEGTKEINQLSNWTSEKPIKYIFIKGSKCGHLYNVESTPNGSPENMVYVLAKATSGAKFLYVEFYYEEEQSEPTCELTSEPSSEATSEPTSEVTPEVTSEETSETTSEPTSEPTSEATSEPTSEESSVLEEVTTSSPEKLPKTGESSSVTFTIVGLVLISAGLLIRKRIS